MNGQCQETSEIRRSLPEDRKHHIIVLLGQMLDHTLAEAGNNEGSPTRKGREHPGMMKHETVHLQSTSQVDAYG